MKYIVIAIDDRYTWEEIKRAVEVIQQDTVEMHECEDTCYDDNSCEVIGEITSAITTTISSDATKKIENGEK